MYVHNQIFTDWQTSQNKIFMYILMCSWIARIQSDSKHLVMIIMRSWVYFPVFKRAKDLSRYNEGNWNMMICTVRTLPAGVSLGNEDRSWLENTLIGSVYVCCFMTRDRCYDLYLFRDF
jgi:hypothetical protein